MKIREIVQEEAAVATQEPEPTQQDIQQIQGLLGTIDTAKEEPQGLLNKVTSWLKQYPILDRVTDIIPQTRLVKAIASAIDAVETGDSKGALNALASVVGGGVAQAARAVNVGTALAQGDAQGAALAAGGTVGKVAKAANTVDRVQTALAPRVASESYSQDEVKRLKQLANV